MKNIGIFVVLQLIAFVSAAQELNPIYEHGLTVSGSFVGALKYPGLKVGTSYRVIDKKIEKAKSGGRIKTLLKNRNVIAHLGFYSHPDYNVNFFLQGGYQWQRMRSTGWFRTIEPQLGISRTLIDGAVYKVTNDGTVNKRNSAGHFYLAPSVSLGLGKDLSLKHESLPLTAFIKATLYTNFPYNNFIYFRLMAELGLSYHLPRIMVHKVKTKYKSNKQTK